MSIRIESQNYQSRSVAKTSYTADAAETQTFAQVMQKQEKLTQQQAEYFRDKYWNDRTLEVSEARQLTAELAEIGVIDEDTIETMTGALEGSRDGKWTKETCFAYMESLDGAGIEPTEENKFGRSFKEFLLDKDSHTWTNEWGGMGYITTGKLTQLGPGFNLQSTGSRTLTPEQMEQLKSKYMADGELSYDDARYLLGELSQMGVIDGHFAWDIELGMPYSRDFSKPRTVADTFKELMDFLIERYKHYDLFSTESSDIDTRIESKDRAEKYQKIFDILQQINGDEAYKDALETMQGA